MLDDDALVDLSEPVRGNIEQRRAVRPDFNASGRSALASTSHIRLGTGGPRGTLSVGHPPTFMAAVDDIVKDAIKVFNSTGHKTVEGALFCYPLKWLDELLAGFLTHQKQELDVGVVGDDAISRAAD
ncbi:hypothetical protein [Paraburkholderia youngii]|uniref:Uncharacterized protein n=2 Tax=Paraburkholderia youngii TaxID=2782701 RepID=A0A7Y6K9G6_9BURK|nr:hypothetical protein [Paraburkholderia youngii]NUY05820.1 hypothetical protein [Paraburkholderia youngii]